MRYVKVNVNKIDLCPDVCKPVAPIFNANMNYL